jgi:hypothetical protein
MGKTKTQHRILVTKIATMIAWWGYFFIRVMVFPVIAQDWSTTGDDPAQLKDLEVVFEKVISIVLTLSGIAAFVMLVVGGFQYLTAGDNPKNVEKASQTLTSALLGVILVLAAWFILQAIESITGLNVTVFKIGD